LRRGFAKLSADPGVPMLYYAVVFLIVALIAALFGFTGIAAGAAGIAKILFVVFLIFAVIGFPVGISRRSSARHLYKLRIYLEWRTFMDIATRRRSHARPNAKAKAEQLASDFQNFVGDVEQVLKSASHLPGDSLSVARSRLEEKVEQARTQLANTLSD